MTLKAKIIIGTSLLAIGLGAWFLYEHHKKGQKPLPSPTPSPSPEPTAPDTRMVGDKDTRPKPTVEVKETTSVYANQDNVNVYDIYKAGKILKTVNKGDYIGIPKGDMGKDAMYVQTSSGKGWVTKALTKLK